MLSGKGMRRLAVGVSVVWIVALYAYTESSDRFRLFLYVGLLPVLVLWIALWIRSGFRTERQSGRGRRWWRK